MANAESCEYSFLFSCVLMTASKVRDSRLDRMHIGMGVYVPIKLAEFHQFDVEVVINVREGAGDIVVGWKINAVFGKLVSGLISCDADMGRHPQKDDLCMILYAVENFSNSVD